MQILDPSHLPILATIHDMIVSWRNTLQSIDMPLQHNYWLWKIIGLGGMIIFGSRTFVQWIHSERHGESKVPVIYWWLSVVGTLFCLAYALRQKDSVFILMYLTNTIPYIRNLMLIQRRAKERREEAQGFPVQSASTKAA